MRVLGIEFGSWSIKAVEMESRFRKFDVLDFHEIRLPLKFTDPAATYKKAIDELMARLPAHPDKIVTSIPAAQTAIRFIQLPVKKRKKVEQMYRFELEDNIPLKLEDSIVEHQVYGTREGSLVFAVVAPKPLVSNQIEWLKSVGIDPDWLTFEGMGLINLFLTSTAEAEDQSGPTLVLDIGHQKTNFFIIEQAQLQYIRSLSWGGQSLNQAIAINYGMSLEDAENLKITELKLTPAQNKSELTDVASQSLHSFLTELNHSLSAYRNLYKKEIKNIYITGGTANIEGLNSHLERVLNAPVHIFKPFTNLSVKEELKKTNPYRFNEAWGRALVFSRKAPLLFNFRAENLSKQTSLNEVSTIFRNPAIHKPAQWAAILAAILFIHVSISDFLADKEFQTANDELKKVLKDTFKNIPNKTLTNLIANQDDLKKYIDQKNTDLEQKLKLAGKTRSSALSMVNKISGAFPAGTKVDVNRLEFDDSIFNLEGVLYEGDVQQITGALQQISFLKDVTLQHNGQRFSYNAKVAGK